MSFSELSVELQLEIFSYFTPIELTRIERVSSGFQGLTFDSSLSKTFEEKIRTLSAYTKVTIQGNTPHRQYKNLTALMKKQYEANRISKLFQRVPVLIEEEHELMLSHLLIHEGTIKISGISATSYDFSTLQNIIMKQGPIDLILKNLNLESKNLTFLKPLIENEKISSLMLTKDRIDATSIHWLKGQMEFMEDLENDYERGQDSLLIFFQLRSIVSEISSR